MALYSISYKASKIGKIACFHTLRDRKKKYFLNKKIESMNWHRNVTLVKQWKRNKILTKRQRVRWNLMKCVYILHPTHIYASHKITNIFIGEMK